jgi:uncharacterized membrane protein
MSDLSTLSIHVILGMGVVTYATKAGGLWVLDRIEISERTRTGLEALPSGIVIALLVPQLVRGGVPEWIATIAVVVVASLTDSVLLALCVGVGTVVLLRGTVVTL